MTLHQLAVLHSNIISCQQRGRERTRAVTKAVHSYLYLFSADIISTVEFNYSGELLATGDKGGRVVIFQHEQEVRSTQTNERLHEQLNVTTYNLTVAM